MHSLRMLTISKSVAGRNVPVEIHKDKQVKPTE
jgi:hypothetical protein